MNTTLHFSDIPHDWAICFQQDCPLADTCLRHHAAMLAPESLRYHNTVLPGARNAETCTLFAEDKPVRIARGMKSMFPTEQSWLDKRLRAEVISIFGSRAQYYRYRVGDYTVSPEQQLRVAEAFRALGIKQEPRYDQTFLQYYFPKQTPSQQ